MSHNTSPNFSVGDIVYDPVRDLIHKKAGTGKVLSSSLRGKASVLFVTIEFDDGHTDSVCSIGLEKIKGD